MKTIEDAVIELSGVWPSTVAACTNMKMFKSKTEWRCSTSPSACLFTKSQFNQRAKELGYINGYRWGVEYPTNGKRPELADDVKVMCFGYEGVNCGNGRVFERRWDLMGKFKITDQRFKPVDISYLNIEPQDHIVEANEMVSDWWDYDKLQVKSGKLIPAGSEVLFFDRAPNPFKCKVMYSSEYVTVIRCIDGSVNKEMIGVDISRCPFEENFNQIKPLDWNRKAELERKELIQRAKDALPDDAPMIGNWNTIIWVIERLVDTGVIRK